MSLLNKKVYVNGKVVLYRDSAGSGPGKTVGPGVFTVNHINNGSVAPVHICNENGDLGWIKVKSTSLTMTSNPPLPVLQPVEACI
ncbi:hypothetical protein GPJ56_010664 [Histomonas meleagridis]|uniref:uncharacterized protein n=1 Tax=Histomonas meleagridis TaxID=135588 RepID=UPI00355A1EF8|nr:hypothetical protein GPJ56_010664 [Histomonas meleagridis]KAH0806936.1 hypothetical protein GO595_000112 [Histomonas meleagridis]